MLFSGYKQLLSIRRSHPAFNPNAPQKVLDSNKHVFTLLRSDMQMQEQILCLVNVSPQHHAVQIVLDELGLLNTKTFIDLLGGQKYSPKSGELDIVIKGFQTMWLLAGDSITKN